MKLVFYDARFQGDVNDIHEKIQYLVDYFCAGNKASFSREAGIPAPVIASLTGGRKSKPSFEVLQKILAHFPVDANWLVMGQGPMLKEDNSAGSLDAVQEAEDTLHKAVADSQQVELAHLRQQLADMGKQVDFLLRRVAELG